ncbi:hypothetical protein D3C71_1660030 [compost metagenome]
MGRSYLDQAPGGPAGDSACLDSGASGILELRAAVSASGFHDQPDQQPADRRCGDADYDRTGRFGGLFNRTLRHGRKPSAEYTAAHADDSAGRRHRARLSVRLSGTSARYAYPADPDVLRAEHGACDLAAARLFRLTGG